MTIPIQSGMMIIAGASLGRVGLGERVSIRSVAAIGLLLAAFVLLGLGAETAGQSLASLAPLRQAGGYSSWPSALRRWPG